jgi:hypothetical protein
LKHLSVPLIVFALVLQLFGYYSFAKKIEPFMYQFYMIAWWSYIVFLDAVLARKNGRFLVLNRRLGYLIVMSAAFWCLFELVNLRLQNWFYAAIPSDPIIRFPGYLIAFGTVIPAIYLTMELFLRFLPEIGVKTVSLGRLPAYAIPLGFVLLLFSLLFPLYFFALAWVFLAFILDGYHYWKGRPSFLAELERGSLTRIVAAALSGLVCGLLWEFWNYWAITKWIYTVPFFEDLKIFEMPLPGYIGFAFFAFETIAFLDFLRYNPFFSGRPWSASLCALVFSVFCFFMIDRYTVFSHTAGVEELTFLTEAHREELIVRGVQASYAIDPNMLSEGERQELALIHLKGLGLEHFERLKGHGVDSIPSLASLNQGELASAMEEQNMRRVRVYLKAARRHQAAVQPR